MATIHEIIAKAKEYLLEFDEARILRAYDFAEKAHSGQTRFSGEPYIIHPLSATYVLLDFHPSENMIISELLHDVAEDTKYTLDDIEANFGKEVRELCWGMQKLSKVRSRLNDPQIENLRKLFLAMAKDYRVVLLKLCDRLHNMSTLDAVCPEKRIRIAQETLNIYAPIAARLGIYRLKSQLEDICLKYLYPNEYKDIYDQLAKTEKWRDKYIEDAKKILMDILSQDGIQSRIEGRVKSIYSIFRKMRKKGKTFLDEIFDVFAMRIILPDIYKYGKEYTGHIYTTLGVLHKNFTPLANRFKDYIAVPKVNSYRSLHTTVMGLGPKIYAQPTEIQIRTESMHQESEFGVAAHWFYKEGHEADLLQQKFEGALAADGEYGLQQRQDWLGGLKRIEEEIKDNEELIENLKLDTFQDRIFVLTPHGDVKDLPFGATPIDFAYTVHTEVGDHYHAAKVNGNIVPLDYELKNGEVVEIVTRKNSHPSQYWLTCAKTSHAKNRIRAWFYNLDDSKHLKTGRKILNGKLSHIGMPALDVTMSVLRDYGNKNLSVRDREQVLIEIGKGELAANSVIKKIFTMDELLVGKKHKDKIARPVAPAEKPVSLFIGGERNVPYHFVKCCDANLKDDLVGYVTRGRGVSLHKKTCRVIRNIGHHRRIPVHLEGQNIKYSVHVVIEVDDRVGLVRDISKVIADNTVNIVDMLPASISKESHSQLHFIVEVLNFDQLDFLLSGLEKISSVRRAFKIN